MYSLSHTWEGIHYHVGLKISLIFLQDKAFNLVMRVLTAFKSAEVEKAVKILDKNEQDVLMKYIYRGFAEPSEGRSAILLTWHEKVRNIVSFGN